MSLLPSVQFIPALRRSPPEEGRLRLAIFGMSKFRFHVQSQKITGRAGREFIPAARSGLIQTCSKNKGGDKSLSSRPVMFSFSAKLTNFFLTKARSQMSKLQRPPEEGHLYSRNRTWQFALRQGGRNSVGVARPTPPAFPG